MDLFTALSLGRMPLSKQALGALLADARKLRKKTVKRVHGVIDATQLPQALAQMVVAYAFAGIGEDTGGGDDSGDGARASGTAAAGKPSSGCGHRMRALTWFLWSSCSPVCPISLCKPAQRWRPARPYCGRKSRASGEPAGARRAQRTPRGLPQGNQARALVACGHSAGSCEWRERCVEWRRGCSGGEAAVGNEDAWHRIS
jgi:hypothetical protein